MYAENLEEKKNPTGLLVVSAIFAIRVHYVNVLNSPRAQEPVKRLTKILLEDYDTRYHPPAGNVGKWSSLENLRLKSTIVKWEFTLNYLLRHLLIHVQERGWRRRCYLINARTCMILYSTLWLVWHWTKKRRTIVTTEMKLIMHMNLLLRPELITIVWPMFVSGFDVNSFLLRLVLIPKLETIDVSRQ